MSHLMLQVWELGFENHGSVPKGVRVCWGKCQFSHPAATGHVCVFWEGRVRTVVPKTPGLQSPKHPFLGDESRSVNSNTP